MFPRSPSISVIKEDKKVETVSTMVSSSRMSLITPLVLTLVLIHCMVITGFTTLSSVSPLFSQHPTFTRHGNSPVPLTVSQQLTLITLSADAVDDRDVNGDDGDNILGKSIESRRSFFLQIASVPVTIGSGIIAAPRLKDVSTFRFGASMTTIPIKLGSVEEVLNLIEERCDRKFLHAVVSSDYRFLYRGMSPNWKQLPTVVEGEGSDLLQPETYGDPEAVTFFRKLDEAMDSRPVRPGMNGHLATTSVGDAAVWGSPVSIWPLAGVEGDKYAHFAWYEDGGTFWPRPKAWSTTVTSVDDGIIVDGINCGSVNLEDALRSKDGEILFSTDSYLAISSKWDKELREGLRNAFIL